MTDKLAETAHAEKSDIYLARYTTFELAKLFEQYPRVVVLLPVGSVEPHGPHLSLETDTIISISSAEAAVVKLDEKGYKSLIAPAIPYGVTNCAQQFKGAISVDADALSTFIHSVIKGYISNGFAHCCVINNHLEPEQDQAVRKAITQLKKGQASIASPLSRRWARTLTDEYKKGECHAGQYETSIVLAGAATSVRRELLSKLERVPISLSDQLNNGVSDFMEMGMKLAYAGNPSDATVEEGIQTLDKLAEMITAEVIENIH